MLHDLFSRTPIVTAGELRSAGVHPRDLQATIGAGEIFRAGWGVYVHHSLSGERELDFAVACYSTGGGIGHLSAAAWHSLCDAVPGAIEVIVPNSFRRSAGEPVMRLIRLRQPRLDLGFTATDYHGLPLIVATPERAIVDLYRIEPDVTRQHAVASLISFVREGGDQNSLYAIARQLGAWTQIQPELEAANEALTQGFKP